MTEAIGCDGTRAAPPDLTDRSVIAEPYEHYAWLRRHEPVHRLRGRDVWALTRYADVSAALRQHDVFSSRNMLSDLVPNIFNSDPPEHTTYRRLVSSAFTRDVITQVRSTTERFTTAAVADLRLRRRDDLTESFAETLPLRVITELLGLPEPDHGDLMSWSSALVDTISVTLGYDDPACDDPVSATADLMAYLLDHIESCRRQPTDNLVTVLTAAASDLGVTDYELVLLCVMLLLAGHATTAGLLANSCHVLATHPSVARMLRQHPGRIGAFVNEVLRYDAPLQATVRTVTTDTYVDDVRIPAGHRVVLYLGSANRDGERFAEPDCFRLDRPGTREHVSFGLGIHGCLGAAVAQTEAVTSLEILLREIPYLELDPLHDPVRLNRPGARGFLSLPVVVHPADDGRGEPASPSRSRSWPGVHRGERAMGIVATTARSGVAAGLLRVRSVFADAESRRAMESAQQEKAAQEVVALLGSKKGVLMKLGQMLSFMDTGLPDVYRRALAVLQTDSDPLPYPVIASLVEQELGAPVERIFSSFSRQPLASASIGQVHRARLPGQRDVAVKVQYPGIADCVRADLDNIHLLATLVSISSVLTGVKLDSKAVADEIAERIGEELDYRLEARNMERFRERFAGDRHVVIPEVVDELSTAKVLTTQFVHGRRWEAAAAADQSARDRWGEAIFRFVMGGIYHHGLLNADPHPGNYLFLDDGAVAFLDFGAVVTIADEQIASLEGIARSVLSADPDRLKGCLRDLGYLDDRAAIDSGRLLAWLRPVYEPLMHDWFTYSPEFAQTLFRRHFQTGGEWAKVVRELDQPRELTFLNRVNLGVPSVLGHLRCTGPWATIMDELWSSHRTVDGGAR